MLRKYYNRKCSVEKENSGRGSQKAWRETASHKVALTLTFELVEFRDASLPGYELRSRELELSQVFGVEKLAEYWQKRN
jgi:hypothetical protein